MGIFRRRAAQEPLRLSRAQAPAQYAIAEVLSMTREWFDPRVLQYGSGRPFVWMWVTPVNGLMVMPLDEGWCACAMGYDESQNPMSLGINGEIVCSLDTAPETVARTVIKESVTHSLATYISLPRSMQDEAYDGQWASEELLQLGKDGFA